MSTWFSLGGDDVEKTEEEIHEEKLLNLKSVYFSVIQKPLNNEEEIQACIAELVNLINNPLLQISAISETVFESLPFEIQLKYMCLSKCSDLYYDIHNLNDSLQCAMKALELFDRTLNLWKRVYEIASINKIPFCQRLALQHIVDLLLHSSPSEYLSQESFSYYILYIQLCWKLQDLTSLKQFLEILNSFHYSFPTELNEMIEYFKILLSPPNPFLSTPIPPLPTTLNETTLNSLFSLSSQPFQLSSPEVTEVIHVSELSCWSSVLDKVLLCLQERNTNLILEFIFPEVSNNNQQVDSFHVGNLPIQEENEQPTIVNTQNSLYYSTNKQQIDNLVHTDCIDSTFSSLCSYNYLHEKLFFLFLFPMVQTKPLVITPSTTPASSTDSSSSSTSSKRKKQYENLPNVQSPQLSMQEADAIREKNCLLLLRSLIPESNRISFIQFIFNLCDCLDSFPILLLFETPIRLRLYYLLQLLSSYQPSLIQKRPSLILLLYELQFWFNQSKQKLKSIPFFTSINQDFNAVSLYQFVDTTENPIVHLRYIYYLYQVELASKYPQKLRNNCQFIQCLTQEILAWLDIILNDIKPNTPINTMISYRQNVILTDNQYLCINHSVFGVILPFYGSSSFVCHSTFQTSMKDDCLLKDIQLLAEKLTEIACIRQDPLTQQQIETIELTKTLYNDLESESRWLSYLNDHSTIVSHLIGFFLRINPIEIAYQKVHAFIQQIASKNDLYQSLLTNLVRNELLLLQNNSVPQRIKECIIEETFNITLLQVHSGCLDCIVNFLTSCSPYLSFYEYCDYTYNFLLNIPLSQYAVKNGYDVWNVFISYIRSMYNQWKDKTTTTPFCMELIANEPVEKQITVFQLIASISQFAITYVSYILYSKQRVGLFVYSMFYLISLLSSILVDALRFNVISVGQVDTSLIYSSLLTVVNAFHTFVASQTAICSENNGCFLLFQLSLLLSSPNPLQVDDMKAVYQCLRCLFNISNTGTVNHRVWMITSSEHLYYHDIVILNRAIQFLPNLNNTVKTKLFDIMVEWLDFYNRRQSNHALTKEGMFFGVYDDKQLGYVEDILRLRKEIFTVDKIKKLFSQYSTITCPLLSSLYVARCRKNCNKQHSNDILFTPQITREYEREGMWLILALLYNQQDPLCWSRFIQWLLEMEFYSEDNTINELINNTPFNMISQQVPYSFNPCYVLSTTKEKDDIVYMNLYHLFTYLLENKQDILERVLQSPPYSGLYQRYSQESPEIRRLLLLIPWKQLLIIITSYIQTSTQVDTKIKLEILKQTQAVLQIALQLRFDLQTLCSDSLYRAMFSIMTAQLEDNLHQPSTIDLLLQFLLAANSEATSQCNVECKYYSSLIRFKLIHYLFISSQNANQTLQDYVNTRGESCFIKNSELFFINSTMINPSTTCQVCNQKLRSNDGVVCYCCGKAFHIHCSKQQKLIITLPNCHPMCVFCCRVDIPSLQRTFLQNLLNACNYLTNLKPMSFEGNEFHIDIINEIVNYQIMSEQQVLDSLFNLYSRFYKKGLVLGYNETVVKSASLISIFGRKKDYLLHKAIILQQSVGFYWKHYNCRSLVTIIEHIYKQNTVFTSSIISLVMDNIQLLIDSFPLTVSGLVNYALLVNCLLTVLKARSKNYCLEEDPCFMTAYNGFVNCIQTLKRFSNEMTLGNDTVTTLSKLNTLSNPYPISFQNSTKVAKEVLRMYSDQL